jgi:hypothetical protein
MESARPLHPSPPQALTRALVLAQGQMQVQVMVPSREMVSRPREQTCRDSRSRSVRERLLPMQTLY